MTDDELRAAYASAVARRGAGAREGCPPLDELAALVERRGDEGSRLRTLDHAMACGAGCAAELELLRSMRTAAQAADPASTTTGVTSLSAWRGRWPLPAAVAALMLVGVGIVTNRRGHPARERPAEVVRGGESSAVIVVEPGDGAIVHGGTTLVWRAVPGAGGYTVESIAPGSDVTSSIVTRDTTVAWQPPPGAAPGDYRWWVRTTDVDGIVHESPMRRLRVAAPGS